MNGSSNGAEDGFALLETVIAFVILAIALAVGMETISQSARGFVRAGDMDRASQILDDLAATRIRTLAEGGILESGPDTEQAWRVSAEPVRDGHSRPLLAVTVTIWPRGQEGPQYTYHSFASATAEP